MTLRRLFRPALAAALLTPELLARPRNVAALARSPRNAPCSQQNIPNATGTTALERLGAATPSPSTADRTEIAGVMTLSP